MNVLERLQRSLLNDRKYRLYRLYRFREQIAYWGLCRVKRPV